MLLEKKNDHTIQANDGDRLSMIMFVKLLAQIWQIERLLRGGLLRGAM